MSRIFKYPLQIVSTQVLDLPSTAEILSVMAQHNDLVLYARIDDSEIEHLPRTIEIVGTGRPMADTAPTRYIGTASPGDGSLVWHVFERFACFAPGTYHYDQCITRDGAGRL